jgi:copper chaperone CopZ
MVPLCCEKCENRVKEQLLDLDGKPAMDSHVLGSVLLFFFSGVQYRLSTVAGNESSCHMTPNTLRSPNVWFSDFQVFGILDADVQRVTCDQWSQKVTVTSCIAAERLLKRIQKIKKRSTFWPQHQPGAAKASNGHQGQVQHNQKLPNQVTNDENAPQQLSDY